MVKKKYFENYKAELQITIGIKITKAINNGMEDTLYYYIYPCAIPTSVTYRNLVIY